MKGRQLGLFPGNEDKVGFWLTPPELMRPLEEEFHFDYDACPYPRPEGFNGLLEEWGQKTWCNPPFVGSLSPWTRKAITESKKGKLVVMILPITAWIEDLMTAGAEFRFMGRVQWMNPKGQRTPRPRYPSAIFVIKPNATFKNVGDESR